MSADSLRVSSSRTACSCAVRRCCSSSFDISSVIDESWSSLDFSSPARRSAALSIPCSSVDLRHSFSSELKQKQHNTVILTIKILRVKGGAKTRHCWSKRCQIFTHSVVTVSYVGSLMTALLWPPYVIGGGALYFCAVVCSSSFFLLFSSPNLSRHRLDVCHTSTHGVALVRT